VSLELSRHLFPLEATHGVGGGAVCHWGCFFFPLSSLENHTHYSRF